MFTFGDQHDPRPRIAYEDPGTVTLPNEQAVTVAAGSLTITEDGTMLELSSPPSGVAGIASIRISTPAARPPP